MMRSLSIESIDLDLVKLDIDGQSVQIRKGAMIIEAADVLGAVIPRFCYHRKLPVAANCRMCLVDVEMGGRAIPKPQPACATPVSEGMKVNTRSDRALKFQKDVMEFLLINHPLDCPICDQGGECELQDVALGYGRSISRFTERKRTVADEDIGPLVATEMTRCIHCTRCVRFTTEIAGTYELGGVFRGEDMQISTGIGKTLETELSGNIIDVCPVGALTNKPFQFRARAWELIAKPSIGYHDALGSNLWLHVHHGQVLRVVPRDNESINECWLADRDRYSHQGLYAADRLHVPQLRHRNHWQVVSWDDALVAVTDILQSVSGDALGILVNPSTTLEEADLLMRLARGLGSIHIDHRLRQLDFSGHALATCFELPVAQVERIQTALLVGSDLRREMPLLNHRLHQATRRGARVYAVNPVDFEFNYELAATSIVPPQKMVDALLALASAVVASGVRAPEALADAIATIDHDDKHKVMMDALHTGRAVLIVGELAVTHPQASWLRAVARFIARATGAAYNELPVGANAIGLAQLGVVPESGGLNGQAMLSQPRQAYVIYGAEPPHDFAHGALTMKALKGAKVVAFSAFATSALREVADVIVPITLLPEMDGTLVNVDGLAQPVGAGAKAPGQARAGWKVLRALGGAMQLPEFAFSDLAGLRRDIVIRTVPADETLIQPERVCGLVRLATWPIYRGDAVLRRAQALNAHPLNRDPAVRLNADEAVRQGLAHAVKVRVADTVVLPLVIDRSVPEGTVWIEAAQDITAILPPYGAVITLSKV